MTFNLDFFLKEHNETPPMLLEQISIAVSHTNALLLLLLLNLTPFCLNNGGGGGGGGRGSSGGRMRAPGEEFHGFDSRCGRPLPTGWVGVSIM